MLRWVAGPFRWIAGLGEKRYLLFIYLLALAPRLAFVLAAGRAAPGVDEWEYDMIAQSLAEGKGYCWFMGLPTAFRPPGLPFFMAGIYWLFGPNYYLARILQTFITAALPIVTYFVCRKVLHQKAARWSAVFVALYIPLILYSVGLLTENLFMPLLMVALLLLLKTQDGRPRLYSVLAGLVLGTAILVRPSITFFIVALPVWFYLSKRDWREAAVNSAIIVAIVAVMVTPWCVRNYRLTGQFVYLDTRAGYNLYIGYREEADGRFDMSAAEILANRLRQRIFTGEAENDVEMHNWGKEQALAFIKAHPWRAVALIPFKFMHFWNLEQNMFLVAYSFNYIGAVPVPLLVVFFVFLLIPFAFLTVFSVVGVAFAEAFDRKLWLLLLLVLYYSALHSVVFGEARLHLPLIPILAILAANGLLRLRHARKALASDDTVVRRGARARAAVAAACIAGFIGIWVYGFIYTLPKWAAVLTPGGNTAQLPY